MKATEQSFLLVQFIMRYNEIFLRIYTVMPNELSVNRQHFISVVFVQQFLLEPNR